MQTETVCLGPTVRQHVSKVSKSLACSIKQTQKLTVPDSPRGIMLNWKKTQSGYLLELPPVLRVVHMHVWAQMWAVFHYMREECRHRGTGAFLGWERVENKLSAAWDCPFALRWADSVGSLEELTQALFDAACRGITEQMCRCCRAKTHGSQRAKKTEGRKLNYTFEKRTSQTERGRSSKAMSLYINLTGWSSSVSSCSRHEQCIWLSHRVHSALYRPSRTRQLNNWIIDMNPSPQVYKDKILGLFPSSKDQENMRKCLHSSNTIHNDVQIGNNTVKIYRWGHPQTFSSHKSSMSLLRFDLNKWLLNLDSSEQKQSQRLNACARLARVTSEEPV